jgi:hypothetical protein
MKNINYGFYEFQGETFLATNVCMVGGNVYFTFQRIRNDIPDKESMRLVCDYNIASQWNNLKMNRTVKTLLGV